MAKHKWRICCLCVIGVGILIGMFLSSLVGGSSNVTLLSHSGFTAINNQYYVVAGEIQNTGNIPVRNVKINVSLFDSDGKKLYSELTPTFMDVIPPGGKSPFIVMWFGEEKAVEVAYYTISDISYTEFPEGKPQKLEIVWSTYSFPDIIGAIKNSGDKNATFIKVIATFYDIEGKVIAANSDLSIHHLNPGSTAEFHITFPFQEESIIQRAKKYELIAESREYLLKMDVQTNPYQNNPYKFLTYIVIILVVLIISLLFYISHARKRKKKYKKKLKMSLTRRKI